MVDDKENLTPKTPKYVEAFQSFIEKRSKNQTPMSPKRGENGVETRSTISRRKQNENLLHEEKMSFCKRKLDFKQKVIKQEENVSHQNPIKLEAKTAKGKGQSVSENVKSSGISSSPRELKNGKNKKKWVLKNKSVPNFNRTTIPKPAENETKKSMKKRNISNEKQFEKKTLSASLKNKKVKDESESDSESKEEKKNQKKLLNELRKLFKDNNIPLQPRAATRGDGNCFFRSVADQILLHQIPNKPSTHTSLRLAVCDHIKKLPPAILQNTVDIVFKGKRRGLIGLASRQRKSRQFVDDNGVMVMATALFLGRNIQVYSENALHEATKIDGGEGADELPPLTIFYFRDYQHYQSVAPTNIC